MITQIFSEFSTASKLWVYAANRALRAEEVLVIQSRLDAFTQTWTAHEMPMKAKGLVLHKQIIVMALDETQYSVSGCGIDKSVKLIKELGEQLQIQFFDRMILLVQSGDNIETYNKQSIQAALDKGTIDENTLVWNPVVTNLGEFLNKGFVKLSDFWMAPQLKFLVQTK